MPDLDTIIREVIRDHFPGDVLDRVQIFAAVWERLDDNTKIELGRRPVRRRVTSVIKHDPLEPRLPGLDDAYPTPERSLLIKRKALTHEQAIWALKQMDNADDEIFTRRKVRRNAFANWIVATFGSLERKAT
jgi:hypothetical protein